MANPITAETVLGALENVKEPALGKSLVGANLVRDVKVKKTK